MSTKTIFLVFLFLIFFYFCSDVSNSSNNSTKKSDKSTLTTDKWQISLTTNNNKITITGDGLPNYPTGTFPNDGNPHAISKQNVQYEIPLFPQQSKVKTGLATDMPSALLGENFNGAKISYKFGISIGGIVFDPIANAYGGGNAQGSGDYANKRWRYEAVNNQVSLGLDFNHAHVQPSGTYHYHGYPLAEITNKNYQKKIVLIGFAADGFPIYNQYGYTDANDTSSSVKKLTPSYRLKSGKRDLSGSFTISFPYPQGERVLGKNYNPNQNYDGTYVRDYEYVSNLGDLDEYNGRYGKTKEYPNGTYYYVITENFPYIPRFFKGTPDASFKVGK